MRVDAVLVAAALSSIVLLPVAAGQTPVPDVAVTSVGWDRLETGQPTTFNATVENEGDADRSEAFEVRIHLEGASFSVNETVEGLEANNSTVVEASETWDAGPGNHTLNATAKVDDGLPGFQDDLDADNARNRSFQLGPDLVAHDVRARASNPIEGDAIDFEATIENAVGDEDVTESFQVAFEIRSDGGEVETLTASVDGLRGLETDTVPSPDWTAEPGSFEVVATVDATDVVAEVDAGNNEAGDAFAVAPAQPDLVVAEVGPAEPNPLAGEDVPVRATIENQGNAPVETDFPVRFRVNGSTFGPDRHVQVGDGLPPGDAVTVDSQPWTTQGGHHDLTAVADPGDDNVTDEASEANNERTRSIHVGPDLVVPDILWSPEEPAAGSEVAFRPRVLNQGTANVSRETTVELSVPEENVRLTGRVGPLEPGNSTVIDVGSWTPPEPGEYTVQARADADDEADEIDDQNNDATEAMQVGDARPDLVTTRVETDPSAPRGGEETRIRAEVENRGSAAADGFEVQFLRDGEQVGDNATVAGGQVDQLQPGESEVVESDAWTAEVGSRELAVRPDPEDAVTEVREDNNDGTATSLVGPDATVRDVRWEPPNPDAGETVAFRVVAENAGTEALENLDARVQVDGAAVGNATIGALAPDANDTATVNWTATRGDHTVTAILDPEDNATEAREDNNRRQESFSTTANANLEIAAVRWSPSPRAGDRVVFTADVANAGNADVAGSFDVAFEIGGTPIGTVEVEGLETDREVGVSSDAWTAEAGSHALRVRADPADVVSESDESDNGATDTVVVESAPPADGGGSGVGPPNLVLAGLRAPRDPGVGDRVTFLATVENRGGEGAAATSVRFLLDGETLGEAEVEALGAGQSASVTSEAWTATAGRHTATAVVDPEGSVDEGAEDDNEHRAQVRVAGNATPESPGDAGIRLHDVNTTSPARPGEAVALRVTVANEGPGAVRDVAVTFLVDDEPVGEAELARLTAGDEATLRGPTWNATEGEHALEARADGAETRTTIRVAGDGEAEGVPGPGLAALLAALAAAAARRREP